MQIDMSWKIKICVWKKDTVEVSYLMEVSQHFNIKFYYNSKKQYYTHSHAEYDNELKIQ